DPETGTLSWSYVNAGDCDLSGEVGVSDITPIAEHYCETVEYDEDGNPTGDPETPEGALNHLLAWIDCDHSGEIGISDITPIAENYLAEVAKYAIITSDDPDAGWLEVAWAYPPDPPFDAPPAFNVPIPATTGAFIAVRPLDSDGKPGAVGNIVTLADFVPAHVESVSPIKGVAGRQTTFTASVVGTPPVAYEWHFGGGAEPDVSYKPAPVVFLDDRGEYDASLTVTNAFGSDTFEFALSVGEPPDITDVLPRSGVTGTAVTFSATVSGTPPLTYSWNFSGWAATPNTSTAPSPTVTLGFPGEHPASLTVTNDYGEDTLEFTLTVETAGEAPDITDVQPRGGLEGTGISLSATVEGTLPFTYSWNFGVGATPYRSAEESPTVTLGSPGEYASRVTVENAYGDNTFYFTLTVGELPDITDVQPQNGVANSEVTFDATITGTPPFTYAWDFGGGATPDTSTEEIPTVTLGDISRYSASLTVENTYGSDILEFDLLVRQDWHIETVDSAGNVGGRSSLALDSSGYPHVSYYDDTNDDLKYAYMDASGWHIETAESEGDVGSKSSIALDSSGYPHVSYYDYTPNYDLKYAYMDESGWHIEIVDGEGDVGSETSIALDSSGYPHVGYWDAINGDLKYAYLDVSGWNIETVDSKGSVGLYTSIAVDSGGYPHVSYCSYNLWPYILEDLKYAYMDASGWHIETVDSEGNVGEYTSIVLDSDGYPHVSYFGWSNCALKYAYMDESGWHIEILDSGLGINGGYSSIAVDSDGYPQVSYLDDANDDLKYAYLDPSGWHIEIMDNVGSHSSIALDSGGYPHVSYYDWYNGDLKYAYLTD
ncbi:PKD domain-containing protein, partial [bacterium]|nr:PKD domain-containing protein [bacterium]